MELFGREALAVEMWDHSRPEDASRNDALAEMALRHRVDLVATNNVHYATAAGFRRASLLAAVRARRSLDEMVGWLPSAATAALRSDGEQRRRFARWPGVVDAAGEIAREISFDLRLVSPRPPDFPTPTTVRSRSPSPSRRRGGDPSLRTAYG
jgi:error-prone DNA polymerase